MWDSVRKNRRSTSVRLISDGRWRRVRFQSFAEVSGRMELNFLPVWDSVEEAEGVLTEEREDCEDIIVKKNEIVFRGTLSDG